MDHLLFADFHDLVPEGFIQLRQKYRRPVKAGALTLAAPPDEGALLDGLQGLPPGDVAVVAWQFGFEPDWRAVERIREGAPAARIVAMASEPTWALMRTAMRHGLFDLLLSPPIDLSDFVETVAAAFEAARAPKPQPPQRPDFVVPPL